MWTILHSGNKDAIRESDKTTSVAHEEGWNCRIELSRTLLDKPSKDCLFDFP